MAEGILGLEGGTASAFQYRPPLSLTDLDARVAFLKARAHELSTLKGYRTGARDYINFCLRYNLPLLPTPSTLARYIAYTSQSIASGPKYLVGARHFLEALYPGWKEARQDPLVQRVIAGSRKVRADPIRRKLPLTTSHLLAFEAAYLLSKDYDDLLMFTILTVGFFALHRLGELIWPDDLSLRDWRKVVKRASLSFSDGRACYHLPYHKTDRFFAGTSIMITTHSSAHSPIDPVATLRSYLAVRDRRHGALPALFVCHDGSIPTRSWFERRFHRLLGAEFGGVSLRSGGATYYARLGISEPILMALGRWKSETFRIYIRDNPTVRAEIELSSLRRPQPNSSASFSSLS